MAKYLAVMTAFGLSRGDTFESDDPRWEQQVKAGNLAHADGGVALSMVDDEIDEVEIDRRIAEGDTEPVKPGQTGRIKVPGPDGGGDGE